MGVTRMSLKRQGRLWKRIQREIVPTNDGGSQWHDCETVLSVVAKFGAAAGFDFSEEDYRTAATEAVERHLEARTDIPAEQVSTVPA